MIQNIKNFGIAFLFIAAMSGFAAIEKVEELCKKRNF
jgi:hypothetical protein